MIIKALQISLIICGIYAATREGMLLGCTRAYIKTMLDKTIGATASEWLSKPLFDCMICMSSLWTIIFEIKNINKATDVLTLAMLICMIAGINTIITSTIRNVWPDESK